jgi:hypothetical protein
LTNKVVTRRTFKQLDPVDVTSIIPDYTVDYEENGTPLENPLDVTTIPIITSDNIDDYRYLIHTTHIDDEDHRLYKIIKIDIIDSDNDGDTKVGYRQHVLHNYKLDHSDTDTDNDIPYHIYDLVRLTNLQQRVGLQATIINGSRYPTNHNLKCTALPPYNIYSALRSAINPPTSIIRDIDLKLIQSKIENKKLRALIKKIYPTDKDKLKQAPRTMRELHKLDDLDPDKQDYLNTLNSQLNSLRTMNVYTSSDNLDINNVPKHINNLLCEIY